MISLLRFWKEGLLVILVGLLWFSHTSNSLLKEEVKMNKISYQEMKGKYADVEHQLDIINKSIEEQKVRFKKSEEDRLKIIITLNKQVNTLRNQVIPKDCEKAIQWSIDNKADISWPKP